MSSSRVERKVVIWALGINNFIVRMLLVSAWLQCSKLATGLMSRRHMNHMEWEKGHFLINYDFHISSSEPWILTCLASLILCFHSCPYCGTQFIHLFLCRVWGLLIYWIIQLVRTEPLINMHCHWQRMADVLGNETWICTSEIREHCRPLCSENQCLMLSEALLLIE